MDRFAQKLTSLDYRLKKSGLQILQVNLGKLCNLSCVHCHVESGPTKTRENMDERTAMAVVRLMDSAPWTTLDLTGGAPELNPHFRSLVTEARRRGMRVLDRCNLTVLFEPGMEDLPGFLKGNRVEIVASLPCYTKDNVDKQRGKGTFEDSIKALRLLNSLGYGTEGSGLVLNLVYNPGGPYLPASQQGLESDYKKQLKDNFGIVFDRLFTITNMPITRWAKYLKAKGQLETYQRLLEESFNPQTLDGLMCRDTLSVGYDGRIYDCDFNQMVSMPITNGTVMTVFDLEPGKLEDWAVRTADHCFGCTAGCGSSCQGALQG